MKELQPLEANHSKLKEEFNLHGCEITLLLRNDFAAILHSVVEFLLKFPNICDILEAEHCKLKANLAALRNLADLVFTCEMVLSASRYL